MNSMNFCWNKIAVAGESWTPKFI